MKKSTMAIVKDPEDRSQTEASLNVRPGGERAGCRQGPDPLTPRVRKKFECRFIN